MTPEQPRSSSLLKVVFGRRADNGWAISGLTSLTLKPRDGGCCNFYEIADEMVILQPTTFGPTSYFLGQSIVPVVAQIHGQNVLRCLGTGFFVSCTGLLITAAHVVSDPIERQYGGVTETSSLTWYAKDLTLGVMIPLNPRIHGQRYIFRQIEWASFLATKAERPLPIAGVNLRLTSDTAICKVVPIAPDMPHQPLTIVQSGVVGIGMSVGKAATAVGYGAMHDVELEAASRCVVVGEFPFQLHVSTGHILERFPDNATTRTAPTPGACFSATLQVPHGMSGSPIFDHEGIYVHGVVSRGWDVAEGDTDLGFGSMLAHSMHVPIRDLQNQSLLELHGNPEHGFAKFSAPGV